jgi:glycosyltransferase involved in cell wall biosynthesis
MKTYSIIIPCYNEAQNIPLILEKFNAVIDRNDIEILLVDNGSFDCTATILQAILPQYTFATTVKVEKNQGYGYGILQGLKAAQGEYLGWAHADFQVDPCDVIRAIKIIEQQSDSVHSFVKGIRRGRSTFDVFFTFGMSCFETMLLRKKLWDINAQPNLFHRSFYKTWHNPPHDFSLDLYALYLARQQKLNMVRFPIVFGNRLYGQGSNASLKQKWRLSIRTIGYSWKMLKKKLMQ